MKRVDKILEPENTQGITIKVKLLLEDGSSVVKFCRTMEQYRQACNFIRQIIVWLTELQELRQSTIGISARSKIIELSKICDTHGHLKKFPWDRGHSEGYIDAIAMVLGYIKQESEV